MDGIIKMSHLTPCSNRCQNINEMSSERECLLTCLPRMTTTSAAPAAVRAHVNRVPRSAWTIGEWSLSIACELPSHRARATICEWRASLAASTVRLRTRESRTNREIREIGLRALSPPHCLSQPPRTPPTHRRTSSHYYHTTDYTTTRPNGAILVSPRPSIETSEYPHARDLRKYAREIMRLFHTYTWTYRRRACVRERGREDLRFLPRADKQGWSCPWRHAGHCVATNFQRYAGQWANRARFIPRMYEGESACLSPVSAPRLEALFVPVINDVKVFPLIDPRPMVKRRNANAFWENGAFFFVGARDVTCDVRPRGATVDL